MHLKGLGYQHRYLIAILLRGLNQKFIIFQLISIFTFRITMTSPPRKVLIVETDYHTMMPICIKNKTPIPVSSEDEESCPSPVYQLEDLHVKVKELLEYRQSYKELFSKTTELVKGWSNF